MRVRIQFGRGRQVHREGRRNQKLALAVGSLLTPAAVMSSVLAVWRLAADIKMTGAFAISSGLFSHWQIWLGCAIALQWTAWSLNKYGRDHDQARS
jgi:hypothetical protein